MSVLPVLFVCVLCNAHPSSAGARPMRSAVSWGFRSTRGLLLVSSWVVFDRRASCRACACVCVCLSLSLTHSLSLSLYVYLVFVCLWVLSRCAGDGVEEGRRGLPSVVCGKVGEKETQGSCVYVLCSSVSKRGCCVWTRCERNESAEWQKDRERGEGGGARWRGAGEQSIECGA